MAGLARLVQPADELRKKSGQNRNSERPLSRSRHSSPRTSCGCGTQHALEFAAEGGGQALTTPSRRASILATRHVFDQRIAPPPARPPSPAPTSYMLPTMTFSTLAMSWRAMTETARWSSWYVTAGRVAQSPPGFGKGISWRQINQTHKDTKEMQSPLAMTQARVRRRVFVSLITQPAIIHQPY